MDKEQARFILRSYRPDGSDGADPQFTEALQLAHADLELGQWQANERSFDAAFAAALAKVVLPASLCQDILASLATERGDIPQASDPVDAAMVGALASIRPPAALRGEVLAAMSSSANAAGTVKRPHSWLWRRGAISLAAAAGIVLAFVATRGEAPPIIRPTAQLPVELVETGFIHTFESPLFSLDKEREDRPVLLAHLQQRKLPCPCCLPQGLADVKGVGCRELVINGKTGSLISYDDPQNGVVHLVVFHRQDVSGELPQREAPGITQHGLWTVACWVHDEKVFMLLGNGTSVAKFAALF